MPTQAQRWEMYLDTLKKPFTKLCRLEFLRADGTIAYVMDNNPKNRRSRAFLQGGSISCNLQNGIRRQAEVNIVNTGGEYDFNVNRLWFGQQIRISEGMVLPDGTDFYLPQGVFYINDPEEEWKPSQKEITLNLVDKWAMLDGTLGGGLDGIYVVPVGSNIFTVMQSLLIQNKGNGIPYDSMYPVFTDYYTSGQLESPYTYRCESDSGTIGEVILGLNEMICGWVGYDATGRLRIDPSQDDILDIRKPILHSFKPDETQLIGASYSIKASDMYNDVIVKGESNGTDPQANGRAQNLDPKSDTNVKLIGRKTLMESKSGYYTNQMCEWYAEFKLKRATVLQKSVSLNCCQLFHIQENGLIAIQRTDKPGQPVERHLIQGFTRPLGQGDMRISAVSVNDFPIATITTDSFA